MVSNYEEELSGALFKSSKKDFRKLKKKRKPWIKKASMKRYIFAKKL